MSGGYLFTRSEKFREEVSIASKTVFALSFILTANSVVYVGGTLLDDLEYTGLGTTTLTLINAALQGDVVIVKE